MCHDSGSSQLAGLKTLISSPQESRPLNSQPPVRADFTPVDSREPHVSISGGRQQNLSPSLSPIRGRPAPILCSGAERGENLTRRASPRDLARPGNADSPSWKACPRDDPSRQEGRRPVRQPVFHFPAFRQSTATSLIQEGNWSRSSARVCSQAKIRWYGYLGEPGNTTPRFTPLGSARLSCIFGLDTGFPFGLPSQPDLIEVDLQVEREGGQSATGSQAPQ